MTTATKTRNGKVSNIMPNLLQAPPRTECIEAIISLDIPQYHEDDVRRLHAIQEYDRWLEDLPKAYHDRITDEIRAEMIEQKFQALPVGLGDVAKQEYFSTQLPSLAETMAREFASYATQYYSATVGISADESVKYEVSKTGRAVTIKLTGPARPAGGGTGRRARKTTEKPSAITARDGELFDFLPTINLEGDKLAKAVQAWQRIVRHADSFDEKDCRHALVVAGWDVNLDGHANWTSMAGNSKVQKIAEHLSPTYVSSLLLENN